MTTSTDRSLLAEGAESTCAQMCPGFEHGEPHTHECASLHVGQPHSDVTQQGADMIEQRLVPLLEESRQIATIATQIFEGLGQGGPALPD